MLISIIIPIYKVEKYIERCIKSVVNQTFTNYEVILIDDASPDNALQIAEKVLKNNNIIFQSIVHQKNRGQSIARNKGIKVAKGKYIMFIDSDDTLSNNKVLNSFYSTIKKEKYDFVSANHYEVYNKKKKITNAYTGKITNNKTVKGDKVLTSYLSSEITVTPWNKLINKNFLLENKLFFTENLVYEDELWTLKLSFFAKKCYLLAEYNYNYYKTNPTSTTKNISYKSIEDLFIIIQKILEKIEKNNCFKTQNINTVLAYYLAKNTTLLKRASFLNNKEVWISYYKKLKKMYNKSSLQKHKKSFLFSDEFAYYIVNKPNQLKTTNIFSKLYSNVLVALNIYNIRGKEALLKEIFQRI